MDKILARHAGKHHSPHVIKTDLTRLALRCAWTEGRWDMIGLQSNTPKYIRALSDLLVRYASTVPR
jgi:hypothetical protein